MIVLYFLEHGNWPSFPPAPWYFTYSATLLQLTKSMAWVNLLTVLALWIRARSPSLQFVRVASISASLALLLCPLALRQVSRDETPAPILCWELQPHGKYRHLPSAQ